MILSCIIVVLREKKNHDPQNNLEMLENITGLYKIYISWENLNFTRIQTFIYTYHLYKGGV